MLVMILEKLPRKWRGAAVSLADRGEAGDVPGEPEPENPG